MDKKNPDTITILIFFFVSALLAAFFGAATNDLVFEILKGYQGLLTGLGAITAALIAYKGAMVKIQQDAVHKAQDDQRHFVARNLYAIRVAHFNMGRIAALLRGLHGDETLTNGDLKRYFKYAPVSPSDGLVACLNNATELDPYVLVQLHRLYDSLEVCNHIINAHMADSDNTVLRTKDGWSDPPAKLLDKKLRSSFDICRVIVYMGRKAVGSEFILTDEEFAEARDNEGVISGLPPEIPVRKGA